MRYSQGNLFFLCSEYCIVLTSGKVPTALAQLYHSLPTIPSTDLFFFFYDSLSEFMFLYWKVQTRSRDCVVTALSKVSRMLSHQKKTTPLSQLSAVFNPGRQLSTTQPLPHSPQVRWGRELGRWSCNNLWIEIKTAYSVKQKCASAKQNTEFLRYFTLAGCPGAVPSWPLGAPGPSLARQHQEQDRPWLCASAAQWLKRCVISTILILNPKQHHTRY